MPKDSIALLITPEGDVKELGLPDATRDRLQLLYQEIGCSTVDVVRLTTGIDMWVDDEFLYNFDEPNIPATLYARRFVPGDPVYRGPVVLTGGGDDQGETLPLTRDKLLAILRQLLGDAE